MKKPATDRGSHPTRGDMKIFVAAVLLSACVADVSVDAWKDLQTESLTINGQAVQITHARVCAPGDEASCHARIQVDSVGEPLATSTPGDGPAAARDAAKITGAA